MQVVQRLQNRDAAAAFAKWAERLQHRKAKVQGIRAAHLHYVMYCLRKSLVGWEVVANHLRSQEALLIRALCHWTNAALLSTLRAWASKVQQKRSHEKVVHSKPSPTVPSLQRIFK